MQVTWRVIPFYDFTLDELYAIMVLRQEVFVVEQTCYYLDCDGLDQAAIHLLGYAPDGRLAAYARIVARGVSYPDYASIGRVITAPFARGSGLGYTLMETAYQTLCTHFGPQSVKISAQAHLQKFYGQLGYVGIGAEYLEDDIPHRAMIRHVN